jgi:tricarballylate dehydrogenase
MSSAIDTDVVVAGSGNAAMSAALAAAEAGARVVVLEKAPREEAGGNTWFTAGAYRVPHGGLKDLRPLLRQPPDPRLDGTLLPAYAEHDFRADLERLTDGRCDPAMADVLVGDARAAVEWLHALGIEFELMYHRQAYELDGGGHRFWGNLALGVVEGGKGLVRRQHAVARARGVEIVFDAGVAELIVEDGAIAGVVCADGRRWRAPAVVLASGGFQADPRMRAEHLGAGWLAAKVRGTRHNTGDALNAALAIGAARAGDWSTCHSVAWDAGTPPHGDRELTNRFTKQSYPLGIVVNTRGERFVDEGADFRNYTYARLGAAIIDQPGALAFQLFDAKTTPLLREDEYTVPGIVRHEAGDLRTLAQAAGIDADGLERTVRAFNAAVQDGPFDPTERDGKGTDGIDPPKSNWAQPLDAPPFLAIPVTCGITFTFGGLRIDVDGRVLDEREEPLAGLFAAGEIAGGLFAGNYPGGSGLTAGTVFGRRAGHAAATAATRPDPAPSAAGVQQEGVAP